MKYPFVIFYRDDAHSCYDDFFINNASSLCCTVYIASTLENVAYLHNCNYNLLVTVGDVGELLSVVSQEMLNTRYLRLTKNMLSSVHAFNHAVNTFYINMCSLDRSLTRPTFSLFTPSFNSFDKILRVYKSLVAQTLLDWEWVIVDDSPNDDNFVFLRKNFIGDQRIRIYRRGENNGSIGNVKNETIGLCRGKYVLEMDHDDELMPYVLKESADIFNSNPELGFIYYDCACIYENGTNQWYGDFICKGYGAYYSQKYNGVWRLIYITPNMNNITMSHLTCCPNHPRIWRKSVLDNMGSYCEYLPICDDYEIIIKSSVMTKCAKVHKLGYIQYMNNSNNNFSLIRNAEINRIGPLYISPIYLEKFDVHNKMRENGAYEDEKYISQYSKIWERDPEIYEHKYCNQIINIDFLKTFLIVGVDSLIKNIDRIRELYSDTTNDFLMLDSKSTTEYLQQKLDTLMLDRIKCYSLQDKTTDILVRYFKMMYLSTKDYEIIDDNVQKLMFNTTIQTRHAIINENVTPDSLYLEIGVEYGITFNGVHCGKKVGVDPDPKCKSDNIVKMTSDEYFLSVAGTGADDKTFDAIFIDGMHHAEYVIRDINGSLANLAKGGKIIIDDILPFNYAEQLKVPILHYYENGILKYGENWTGDVWKVVYYLLLHFFNKITQFKYYYNLSNRGVAILTFAENYFQIDDAVAMAEITGYEYFADYKKYVDLVVKASNIIKV